MKRMLGILLVLAIFFTGPMAVLAQEPNPTPSRAVIISQWTVDGYAGGLQQLRSDMETALAESGWPVVADPAKATAELKLIISSSCSQVGLGGSTRIGNTYVNMYGWNSYRLEINGQIWSKDGFLGPAVRVSSNASSPGSLGASSYGGGYYMSNYSSSNPQKIYQNLAREAARQLAERLNKLYPLVPVQTPSQVGKRETFYFPPSTNPQPGNIVVIGPAYQPVGKARILQVFWEDGSYRTIGEIFQGGKFCDYYSLQR